MKSALVAVAAVVLLCAVAFGEIPQVISCQGKVTDGSGTSVPNGSYNMRFRIWDAETGGIEMWDSGPATVDVSGGVFSVLLGESVGSSIGLAFGQDYWLLVRFDGIDQTPRQRLVSTGYAYMASGLVAGTEVIGEVISGTYAAIKGVNTATTGTQNYGVYGTSAGTAGRGVYGLATTTAGTGQNFGVYGQSGSPTGRGVCGSASATTGTNHGLYGTSFSPSGTGVSGYAFASSGFTDGGRFESYSPSGTGVYGHASTTTGTNYGVFGSSWSTAGTGVFGFASAATGYTYGIYGRSDSPSGYGVYYQGGLAGTGSKSCVVKTSQGPTLMYCQESPENWFEDFGEGRLVDGRAHIELDPLFLETVTIDGANPMKVFVQPQDMDCKGMAAIPGITGFDVGELLGGTTNAVFTYRVVAKRKGFEEKRLDYCQAAETDSYLYPELREKELDEHGEERARMEEEHRRLEEERARSAGMIQVAGE